MNWIPQPPTDNLYKFAAIWGLRLMLGASLFIAWLVSVDIKARSKLDATQNYLRSSATSLQISRRIESINAGAIDKDKPDWVPTQWSSEHELKVLEDALLKHQASMERNKEVMDANTTSDLEFTQRRDVRAFGGFYAFLAASLFVLGFGGWWRRVHRIENAIRDAELKARELTNEKLQIEIALLRRSAPQKGSLGSTDKRGKRAHR